eukprot:TRINITY_DN50788_c0_g1_i1.p1 TRINITY_DN50788_c0_g1~~TRINITY_DN50788_c0_g1_i1.p1  ORF type:complete len:1309 (+),score=386.07 TRINITY_DN50788_c0_g1_i1:459-3929(+)
MAESEEGEEDHPPAAAPADGGAPADVPPAAGGIPDDGSSAATPPGAPDEAADAAAPPHGAPGPLAGPASAAELRSAGAASWYSARQRAADASLPSGSPLSPASPSAAPGGGDAALSPTSSGAFRTAGFATQPDEPEDGGEEGEDDENLKRLKAVLSGAQAGNLFFASAYSPFQSSSKMKVPKRARRKSTRADLLRAMFAGADGGLVDAVRRDPTFEPQGDGCLQGAGHALVATEGRLALHAMQKLTDDDLRAEAERDATRIARKVDEPDICYDALLFSPWERVRVKKAQRARAYFIEALMYLLFVTLFGLFAHTFRSDYTFWIAESVRNSVVRSESHPLSSVDSTDTFFLWAERTLLPGIHATRWYNGDLKNAHDVRFSALHNRVVGMTRFRQVRVERLPTKDCGIPAGDGLDKMVRSCYPAWGRGEYESTLSYGPPWNRTAYRWESEEELCERNGLLLGRGKRQELQYCSTHTRGENNEFYPAGGFVIDFGWNLTANLLLLDTLRHGWVDLQTRAVVIEFTVFNTNVRLMAAARVLVEFMPTGLVHAQHHVKPFSVMAQETGFEIALICIEALLAFSLVIFMLHMFRRFWGFKQTPHVSCIVCRRSAILRTGGEKCYNCNECSHPFNPFHTNRCVRCQMRHSYHLHICWVGFFQDPWNWVDILVCVCFVGVFAARFALRTDLGDLRLVDDDRRFVMLYPLAVQVTVTNYLVSFISLVCFVRAFKYLSTWPKVSLVIATFWSTLGEVLTFFIMYGIMFLGFALVFNLTFGYEIKHYNRYWSSLLRVFMISRGKVDYEELEDSNAALAPIYIAIYILILLMVAVPVAVSIARRCYLGAEDRVARGKESFSHSALLLLWNGFRIKFNMWFGRKTPVTLVHTLLNNLEKVPDLTTRQRDDLRTFRNEIEHQPEDDDLFNGLIRVFDRKVNRQMDARDYELFSDTCNTLRTKKTQADDDDADDDRPQIQRLDELDDDSLGESDSSEDVSPRRSDAGSEASEDESRRQEQPERKKERRESVLRRVQQSINDTKLGVIEESTIRMSELLKSMLQAVREAEELRPFLPRESKMDIPQLGMFSSSHPSRQQPKPQEEQAKRTAWNWLAGDVEGYRSPESQPGKPAPLLPPDQGSSARHSGRSPPDGAAGPADDWYVGERMPGKK